MPATLQMTGKTKEQGQAEPAPDPAKAGPLRIERGPDGSLRAGRGKLEPVRVVRCFPWTRSQQFVSLRGEKDGEVALIEDARELDETSRAHFEAALAEAGFVFRIARIRKAEAIFEVRHWEVETEQGPRRFQTKLDEWPRELAGGGFLIRDAGGDLYHIGNPEGMDARSQRVLWELVD